MEASTHRRAIARPAAAQIPRNPITVTALGVMRLRLDQAQEGRGDGRSGGVPRSCDLGCRWALRPLIVGVAPGVAASGRFGTLG